MPSVAYLIHGTYATDAAWTLPESPIAQAISSTLGPKTQLKRFLWDGKNAFASRIAASEALTAELDATASSNKYSAIYLIAHSHGGNMALQAVNQMAHGDKVRAMVSLGTPYLRIKRKAWAPPVLLSIGLAFWTSLLLTIVLPDQLQFGGIFLLTFLVSSFAFYFLLINARDESHKLTAMQSGKSAARLSILCLRHGGDEASLWLTLLSLPRASERVLAEIGRTLVGKNAFLTVLKLQLLAFGIGALLLFTVPIPIVIYFITALDLLTVTLPLFSFAGTILTAHRFGYGGRPSLRSFFVDVQITSTPWSGETPFETKFSGVCGMIRASTLRPLKIITPHSLGYSDPKAIERLCTWLKVMDTFLSRRPTSLP
ncbi:MAG TPA: hypothetical protein PLC14_20850 [Accumulibacter sp.]|uniref:esterase/lipase family protein n=1 Tax=unclassified Candidatus Accumulibacter TaxID=2619054 RepID=UPI0025C18490|nr:MULTISPECIES: hypothetical protein [unclassified Candidatus Accumulibacter]HRE72938.1 hypothetical protein [Accumulibacter sp.]